MKRPSRKTILFLVVLLMVIGTSCLLVGQSENPLASAMGITVTMPGTSHSGPLPPLTEEQTRVRDGLTKDLERLAGEIGERNLSLPIAYAEAARFVEGRLTDASHEVRRQTYEVKGRPCVNLVAEIPGKGRADEIVVIGAHYDSAPWTPGANDNGSGTVALLALAELLKDFKPDRTLRFVAFANEEPPYFQTDAMGSLVYAKECKRLGENIVAMLALETMGYFRDAPNTQKYPAPFSWFYPNTGNFIAFIGDTESMPLVREVVGSFRRHAAFPSEGGAVPDRVEGAGWSDHWSFWQCGYPGVMVTDTAPFRYPHYHRPTDTPDKVNNDRLARVVVGLRDVITELCSPP
ncbi:MAG: M28 family peptidase [Nitrospirota bacterium]|nr:M28 family peptidase [Nitrospirota bacterium]